MNIDALIPAYNPGEVLISIVDELVRSPLKAIVVVDDGSKPSCEGVFDKISRMEKVTVLRHAINRGKGAALKTGFNHIYCMGKDRPLGVVTIDADGQHIVSDALEIAQTLEDHPHGLVLGVRDLHRNIPLRSYIGNMLTKFLYRLLIGQTITDTQTGLRGIPTQFIPQLLRIESDGYEFELDMLLMCKHSRIEIVQHAITTKYLNNNESSHFAPIRDSMRIYFVLFRFTLASLSTSLIDFIVFWTTFQSFQSIAYCTVMARLFAVAYNYTIVKRFIFYSNQRHSVTLPKYLLLVLGCGVISVSLTSTLVSLGGVHILLAKALAETGIFIANFLIQRDLIFTKTSMRGREAAGLEPAPETVLPIKAAQ